jgi:hypothetical protein
MVRHAGKGVPHFFGYLAVTFKSALLLLGQI